MTPASLPGVLTSGGGGDTCGRELGGRVKGGSCPQGGLPGRRSTRPEPAADPRQERGGSRGAHDAATAGAAGPAPWYPQQQQLHEKRGSRPPAPGPPRPGPAGGGTCSGPPGGAIQQVWGSRRGWGPVRKGKATEAAAVAPEPRRGPGPESHVPGKLTPLHAPLQTQKAPGRCPHPGGSCGGAPTTAPPAKTYTACGGGGGGEGGCVLAESRNS